MSLLPLLELAVCFHHAVRDDEAPLTAAVRRLRRLTDDGDLAFLARIACFMGGLPLPPDARPIRWPDTEAAVRRRWRFLVTERRGLCPP